MVLGSWAIVQMHAAGDNADDIGYMPFPISVNGTQYASAGADYCFGINNNISDNSKLGAPDAECGRAVVTAAIAGVLQGQGIRGDGTIHTGIIGISGESPIPEGQAVAHIPLGSRAVVSMHQQITGADDGDENTGTDVCKNGYEPLHR